MTFSNLVFLDLDAALERDDSPATADHNNNNDAVQNARSADEDEENEHYQQPQRSRENMPPTSSNPCHRLSFRIALASSLVFIVLMMGLAGKHGKSLRATHEAEKRARMAGNVAAASSSASMSASGSAPAPSSSSGAPLVSIANGNANGGDNDDDDVDPEFHIEPHVQEHEVSAAIVTLFGPTARPTTVAPTPLPTKAPTTPSPTQSPTRRPTPSPKASDIVCQDDPTYRSKVGLVCSQHVTLKCGAFSNIGVMLDEEVEELLRRCPVSCRVQGCVEEGEQEVVQADKVEVAAATPKPTAKPTAKPTPKPTQRPTTAKPTANPTRKPTILMPPVPPPPRPTMASAPEPTGTTTTRTSDTSGTAEETSTEEQQCPYGTDDKLYRSPLGQPCEYFREVNCHMLLAIGFHVTEVADIMNACPCACEVKHGTVKIGGGMATGGGGVQSMARPSPISAHTGRSTLRPTRSPVSMSPTKSPSASPTPKPTTPAPTPRPTARPTTSPPSTSPTLKGTEETDPAIMPLILQSVEQIQNVPETSGSSVHPVTVAALVVLSIVITLGILYVAHKRKRGEQILDCLSLGGDSDENSIKDALDESYEDDSVVVVEEEEINEGNEEEGAGELGHEVVAGQEHGHRQVAEEDNPELRSCLRDRSSSSERGHRRSVSWGKARVRRIQRIHSDDSFEDNPHEEETAAPPAPPTIEAPTSPIQTIKEDVLSPQWPSKNELRWYNLGLLKALGEEAMEEVGKGQEERSSSWNWPKFSF